VFTIDGVLHYCVANMPGAVPRTSTPALTNATLAWTLQLAALGPIRAVKESVPLSKAANVLAGRITCPGVAEAFGLAVEPAEELAARL
jgi:alanine dehydrogenase